MKPFHIANIVYSRLKTPLLADFLRARAKIFVFFMQE
jgi:hypothetical protein